MTRTLTFLLSASALALVACSDDTPASESGADAINEGEAEPFDNMDDPAETQADAGGETDQGLRYTEGDERPEDDLGQTPAVNLAQDLAAGPAGVAAGVAAGLSGDVEAYVRNVTLGNMYEVQAGRIAMERGGSQDVREIGRLIVQDHQELQEELVASLAEAGLDLDLPTELEGRRQGLIDNLNAASDANFDAAFLHQQEAAHIEATALHEGFEAAGEPEALTDYAGMAGNVVQGHLEQVTENLPEAVDGE
jgi:putative membrane protein